MRPSHIKGSCPVGAIHCQVDHRDTSGNLTTEIRAGGATRSYTYDAANRLTQIDDATGNDAALAYDPLGRLRTRTVGSDVQTQSYVGSSELAWRQAGTVTTTALVDADGARVGSKSGATASWLVFDPLGSVAALEGSGSAAVTDAFRYDAYGWTIGRYPAGGSAVPVRFRGLLDIAPTADPDVAGAGSDPLYLMGARLYSPHLGSFTSLDSYPGEALNPLSMNRFLYALANPATLIDPDGHKVMWGEGGGTVPSRPAARRAAAALRTVATIPRHRRPRTPRTTPGTPPPAEPMTTRPARTVSSTCRRAIRR